MYFTGYCVMLRFGHTPQNYISITGTSLGLSLYHWSIPYWKWYCILMPYAIYSEDFWIMGCKVCYQRYAMPRCYHLFLGYTSDHITISDMHWLTVCTFIHHHIPINAAGNSHLRTVHRVRSNKTTSFRVDNNFDIHSKGLQYGMPIFLQSV